MVVYAQRVSQDQNAPTRWSGDVIGGYAFELTNGYCVYGKMPYFSSLSDRGVTQKTNQARNGGSTRTRTCDQGIMSPLLLSKKSLNTTY